MATATGKGRCITCGKEKSTVRCEGCLQVFCFDHLLTHRQELSTQLDEIEVNRDVFRQTLTEQTMDKSTSKECRQLVLQHTTEHINQIEVNLVKLTNQLRQTRQENDYDEINLRQLTQKLIQLAEELDKPPNISIETDSTSLVNKISVVVLSRQLLSSTYVNIDIDTKWRQNAITIAGGNGQGNQLNQLSHPYGIYVDDDDQCIYTADQGNHRIVEWKCGAKNGQVVAGGNGQGNRMDQLNKPRDVLVDKKNDALIICDQSNRRVMQWSRRNGTNGKIIISDIGCSGLAMDNNGDLYVSDYLKHEVRRWKIEDTNGAIVAGGNGKGDQLNQLNVPTHIFVDQDYSVYVSDRNNHRVIKWVKDAKEGIVVAGGNGQGSILTQLSYPQGVIIDHLGRLYVADMWNHRIMCWCKESNTGSISVGGNGKGQQPNQFNYLGDLSFDRQGNLYVVDSNNHRVQKFDIDLN